MSIYASNFNKKYGVNMIISNNIQIFFFLRMIQKLINYVCVLFDILRSCWIRTFFLWDSYKVSDPDSSISRTKIKSQRNLYFWHWQKVQTGQNLNTKAILSDPDLQLIYKNDPLSSCGQLMTTVKTDINHPEKQTFWRVWGRIEAYLLPVGQICPRPWWWG